MGERPSRVGEFRAKLQAIDTENQQKAKLFDLKALAASTGKLYTLNDPDLGEIRYGLLTSFDVKDLNLKDVADDEERMYKVAFAMLRKADPSLQEADFEALPFDVKAVLTERLAKVMPSFLLRQQAAGSKPVGKPS